jgi:hypothetical protein
MTDEAPPRAWTRLWRRLRIVETAMAMTPLEFIEARIARLERRLEALDTAAALTDLQAHAE